MYFKHLIQLATLFLVAESLEEDEVEYIRCTLGALYYKNKVTLPDSVCFLLLIEYLLSLATRVNLL